MAEKEVPKPNEAPDAPLSTAESKGGDGDPGGGHEKENGVPASLVTSPSKRVALISPSSKGSCISDSLKIVDCTLFY